MDQGDTSAAIEMLDGHGFEPGLLGAAEGALFDAPGCDLSAHGSAQTGAG
ncbi:MAG: hypothetical protein ACFHWZ_14390 [Phycisphaerales bacterium]